jgi:uncharacterized protein with FMN-binding domain
MRRITLWLFSTLSALVLLFSYRTSTMGADGGMPAAAVAAAPATTPSTAPTGGADPTSPATTSPATTSPSTAATSTAVPASGGDGTYAGTLTQTRWGPIQVSITVVSGKITDVAVPTYPNENHRDQEINAYALPELRQATLAAQSADIDAVSGATVTSDGYKESLQAALDAAHLS